MTKKAQTRQRAKGGLTPRRLIARWNAAQNLETDQPIALRWSDGSPATVEDWGRADTATQTDPAIIYGPDGREVAVEFGYLVEVS